VSTGVLTDEAFKKAGSSIANYVDRVVRNVNHLSDTYFMRGYHQMSPAQQEFAIKMAAGNIQKGKGVIDPKLFDRALLKHRSVLRRMVCKS
jgi:hypothetical protein